MGSRYCSSSPGSSGVHGERQQQNHPCTCWPLSGGTSMHPTARHRWQRPILTHPSVWFQRCITLNTPRILIPLRYCHLCLSLRDPLHLQYPVQLPGEDIRHNSGTKPTAQLSRDSWCLMINKDPATTYKTWFVNVHWLTQSETVLQRTIIS